VEDPFASLHHFLRQPTPTTGDIPALEGCDEFLAFMEEQLAKGKEPDPHSLSSLPLWVCQSVGGDRQPALILATAWRLIHMAAEILDDIEDRDSLEALWWKIGEPRAINLAVALWATSQLSLLELRSYLEERLLLDILSHFNLAIFQMCSGQHLDLTPVSSGMFPRASPSPGLTSRTGSLSCLSRRGKGTGCSNGDTAPLERYWKIAAAKSGEFFRLICRCEALLGRCSQTDVRAFAEYGYNLGILTQLHNDYTGLYFPSEESCCPSKMCDLYRHRLTLPVAYALSLSPSEVEPLERYLVRGEGDIQEIWQLLIDAGALRYTIVKMQIYYQRARGALDSLEGCIPHQGLFDLLDGLSPRSLLSNHAFLPVLAQV